VRRPFCDCEDCSAGATELGESGLPALNGPGALCTRGSVRGDGTMWRPEGMNGFFFGPACCDEAWAASSAGSSLSLAQVDMSSSRSINSDRSTRPVTVEFSACTKALISFFPNDKSRSMMPCRMVDLSSANLLSLSRASKKDSGSFMRRPRMTLLPWWRACLS